MHRRSARLADAGPHRMGHVEHRHGCHVRRHLTFLSRCPDVCVMSRLCAQSGSPARCHGCGSVLARGLEVARIVLFAALSLRTEFSPRSDGRGEEIDHGEHGSLGVERIGRDGFPGLALSLLFGILRFTCPNVRDGRGRPSDRGCGRGGCEGGAVSGMASA